MSVDTKTASKRDLKFDSWDDLRAELDRIEAADAAGEVSVTGNWSAGENLEHCAKLMRFSYDGFEGGAPWPIRKLMRLVYFKKMMGPDPMPSGYKLPKAASSMLPAPETTTSQGIEMMRAQLARVAAGEKMQQPSPVFGPMTNENWTTVHLKHTAMHLGFISLGGS